MAAKVLNIRSADARQEYNFSSNVLMVGKLGTGDTVTAMHRIMPLSISFAHRAVTGSEASRFLGVAIEDLRYNT